MTNLSKLPIGVMQGRLLPKYNGLYQSHPVGYWQEEFPIAKDIELDCIEFIYDTNYPETNPLMSAAGLEEIQSLSLANNINVSTICADYFMEFPLHDKDLKQREKNIIKFDTLIRSAIKLSVTDIILPCVDSSSIRDINVMNELILVLNSLRSVIDGSNIRISVESDLPPRDFAEFLNKVNLNNIFVNYDMGNSASLGYDPAEEFKSYGAKISDIHIKDRKFNGGPVYLGKGDVNFYKVFELIDSINYQGPLIFQAFRDEEGITIFKEQLIFIKNIIKEF